MNIGEHKILSGFMLITCGQMASYALSFLRNVIIARLLSLADFGLAATFGLALATLELTNKMALGRQVVQAPDGDSKSFLNTAHSFQFLAGTISAGALLFLSLPMAQLFKVPDNAWAFALLALVPLSRGLWNQDIHRRQRKFEFLPSILVDLVPQAIVTAIAWPLAALIGDFRVVLILLLGKEILATLISHGIARRRYRWGWDKALAKRIWYFSWPMILNGLLIFGSQQGDQALVGGAYSLEILALYSAGASFIAVPFMIMAQSASSVMLPILSRVHTSTDQFILEYQACAQLCAVGAVAIMTPFILAGEQFLSVLYGSKYVGGGPIMAWLAAGCAFRFIRIVPATAALARADSQNQMISNLFRVSSLLLGVVAVLLGSSVKTIAACMLFGELVALCASTYFLRRRQAIPPAGTLKSAFYVATCLAAAGACFLFGSQQWTLSIVLGASALFIICSLIGARFVFPENASRLWHEVVKLYAKRTTTLGTNKAISK